MRSMGSECSIVRKQGDAEATAANMCDADAVDRKKMYVAVVEELFHICGIVWTYLNLGSGDLHGS